MKKTLLFLILSVYAFCYAQSLPPKEGAEANVNQIHSGHSLTDPLFSNWPGLYVNLVGDLNATSGVALYNVMVGKSTIPGASLEYRWNNASGYGSPDARADIANWELLSITERVPLLYEGGNSQQWYLDGIEAQKEHLSLFVNNAWYNGNNGNGSPTLLWTTWVNIDGSQGNFREMLDIQGEEWESMQDYANSNRPATAPPVYLIPGHKMMARLYDDIELGLVPDITSINQLFSDNIHPNELGAYAVTLIHYACIFNENPVGLTNNLSPNAVDGTPFPSEALASYLQQMIWDVVTNYPRTGLSETLHLNEPALSPNDLFLYPNPTNHFLNWESLAITYLQNVEIYSNLGQIVYSGTKHKIDISHLYSGIYILKVGAMTKTFVKK